MVKEVGKRRKIVSQHWGWRSESCFHPQYPDWLSEVQILVAESFAIASSEQIAFACFHWLVPFISKVPKYENLLVPP